MTRQHNIEITDNPGNWLRWGNLVIMWIKGEETRPRNVGDLKTMLTGYRIDYDIIRGGDGRTVDIVDYDSTGARTITIPLPTMQMVDDDRRYLREEWDAGRRDYPAPTFYDMMYDGPRHAFTDPDDFKKMGKRRLGEYVINECM